MQQDTAQNNFLPLIQAPYAFSANTPIWSHAGAVSSHEIGLFRQTFSLNTELVAAQWHLFADTRYEAWLDGVLIGRGPARFSTRFREWDIFELGTLKPGLHTLAVLVQWAPNTRRSESNVPMLLTHVQNAAGTTTLARSGPSWKAFHTTAWREDAALVHSDQLIGPTELLDFRKLPVDWTSTGFDDATWPTAALVSTPSASASALHAALRPRSIAQLRQDSVLPLVLESGFWSPGRTIRDLSASLPSFTFGLTSTRVVTLETLLPFSRSLRTNGEAVSFTSASPLRPDVWAASMLLAAGQYSVGVAAGESPEASFAISTNAMTDWVPMQQGTHVGRRLLLGEPAANPSAVAVVTRTDLSLTFNAQPSYVVLDLGRVRYGRLMATYTAPPGTVLDIGWDERLFPATKRPLPYPGTGHPEWNATDSWVADGTARTLRTLDARSGRYVLLVAWGAAQLDSIYMQEESYPVTLKGRFESSASDLDEIWRIGVDTARINMTDGYADPWRERGQWWGDSFIVDRVNQVAFGDTDLLKRGVRLMTDAAVDGQPRSLAPNGEGTYILDYGMLWVQNIADYTARTGDATLAYEGLAAVSQFMSRLAAMEDVNSHLLNIPNESWAKSALIDFMAHYGQVGTGAKATAGWSTPVNAMYYGTLLAAADIAAATGDNPSAVAWRNRAAQLRTAINQHLYLPAEGRYLSTYYNGIAGMPTIYAQAWPLAYGVTPPSEKARVANSALALISADPAQPSVGPYGMYWVLEGLAQADRTDAAVRLIRLYYGHMVKLGATTWWESFDSQNRYTSALSHGWGSAPTWFLTRHVLGFRQVRPNTWQLTPQLNMLEKASGEIPLGVEIVRVKWQKPHCGRVVLTVESPASSEGVVIVRLNSKDDIYVSLNGIRMLPQLESTAQPDGTLDYRIHVRGEALQLLTHQPCGSVQAHSPAIQK